jgi:uncharacterized protein YbjT (DUF2867 family)
MPDRILVTGGTGTTGRLVATLLADRGADVRIATRHPSSANQIRFDWDDATTHGPALGGVTSVYLVAPTDRFEHLPVMLPFLQQAVAGVPGRLVLLSASSLDENSPMMGAVHAWLHAHAPRWTVLRPSWFMQNFTTQHLPSIIQEGRVYSATQDGRVPFIDAADIAAVAATALIDPAFVSRDLVLTGPDAMTYDEVADAISAAIDRPVRHCRLSEEELAARYVGVGIPAEYASALADMDKAIARGSEDRITTEVEPIIGRPANKLARFLASHRDILSGA